jgi:hypothetical protein
MGKASSSKKVAKAARAGGSLRATRDRKWGFPLAIAGIVVVGAVLVWFVRDDRLEEAAIPPRIGDHWHNAYAVYECDTFAPPLADVSPDDPLGIHTHSDGLMHIHPFSANASGENATFSVFGEQVGVEFGDNSFSVSGEDFEDGAECGEGEGVVRVLKWEAGAYDEDPEVIDGDLGAIRFTSDGDAYTIFFGPESAFDDFSALLPPSLASINDPSEGEDETPVTFDVPENIAGTTTSAPGSTTSTPDGSTTSTPATSAPETTGPEDTAPETTAAG